MKNNDLVWSNNNKALSIMKMIYSDIQHEKELDPDALQGAIETVYEYLLRNDNLLNDRPELDRVQESLFVA